jgi:pseudoazurin
MFTRPIRNPIAAGALMISLLSMGSASAAEFEVKMLNDGPDHPMQFDPEFVKISPGDTVHFVATDKGHEVKSISGMIPAGAEPFSGNFGENVSVTLTHEGVYGFECGPHGSMGMVGMIVVGHPTNEEAAKSATVPGMAKRTFAKLFRTLDSHLAASN